MNFIEQRKRQRGQGGFTLIELLVVVAILGILAGVAVFAVGGLRTEADSNACEVEKSTIKTANAAANATTATTDTYVGYLDGTPRYFTVAPGGAGNARTVTLTPTASAPAGCTGGTFPATP
jgi:prepilin-type N-terminal cleavage/methylation domain-containing protein